MANGVRIEAREDGRVDVVVEGVDRATGMDLVDRILRTPTAPPAPGRTRKAATAQKAARKIAAKVRCPYCGKMIGPQGRISHMRRNHPAEFAKEQRQKARKAR